MALGGPRVVHDGAVMRLSGSPGWTRATTTFLDFSLRLQFRRATPGAEGAVLLRAWARRDDRWPETGYRVALRSITSAADAGRTVAGFSSVVSVVVPSSSTVPSNDEDWHDLEVTCQGDRLSIRIDGRTVAEVADGLEPGAGYIGLEQVKGTMEYRELRVTLVPVTTGPADGQRIVGKNAPGVTSPRVITEVAPRYTIEALGRVKGTLRLECVVGPDGRVADTHIVSALDPGLDLQGIAAARHWRFEPAKLNGQPIPIIVTLELDFR